jgi:hypothetical protein
VHQDGVATLSGASGTALVTAPFLVWETQGDLARAACLTRTSITRPSLDAFGSSPSPNTSTCRPDMAGRVVSTAVRLELFRVATIFAKG